MIPENVNISTLSNGLTLVTVDQPWKEGIYCNVYVKVGSCDEQLERDKGICHFIEHIILKETEDYTEEQIEKLITGRGGYFNGCTSSIYTKYIFWTQTDFFEDTMSIIDNIIFKPLINNDSVNKEKNIILEEYFLRQSDPDNKIWEVMLEKLFPKHNVKYPTIGTEKSIKNINSTRIKEYLRGYYRPQSIILSLSGKLPEQNELEDILYNKAHGFIRKTRASNSSIVTRNFGEIEEIKENWEGEETWDDVKSSITLTAIGFNTNTLNIKEKISLNILTDLIGGNSNSLMFKKIREDLGLCYSCSSYFSGINDVGIVSFSTYCNKNNIKEVEKQTEKIINDIIKNKIPTDLFEETKNYKIGGYLRNINEGDNFCESISNILIKESESPYPWEYVDSVKSINKKDVYEIAQKILPLPKYTYRILNK